MKLTQSQEEALGHFTKLARARKDNALVTLKHVFRMSNIGWDEFDATMATIKMHARVALHFHPDRPLQDGCLVAESLLSDGIYKSQYETLISNGSVSAHSGGDRDLWEQRLFAGAYQSDNCANGHRPKYGALDLFGHADGPAPRFGSCYLLLKPDASKRSTFTYLDSHQEPEERGTLEEFSDIAAALFAEVFERDFGLGEHHLMPPEVICRLKALSSSRQDPSSHPVMRNLNHYIEAQVHGDITLLDDADILVADPSFQKKRVGHLLQNISDKYRIQLQWHQGFAMQVAEVPKDFRGPTMPAVAAKVAPGGRLDTSLIGEAAVDLKANPDRWTEFGDYRKVLQELKLLWHVLVKYGRPFYENLG